jgi:hypothetical protein
MSDYYNIYISDKFKCNWCELEYEVKTGNEFAQCVDCYGYNFGDNFFYCNNCVRKTYLVDHCMMCDNAMCNDCHSKSLFCFDCKRIMEKGVIFPPGEYYIGDPFIVIYDDVWQKWSNSTVKKYGVKFHEEKFWCVIKMNGGMGGKFQTSMNRFMMIYTGCIGMTPISLCDPHKLAHSKQLGCIYKTDVDIRMKIAKNNVNTNCVFTKIYDNYEEHIITVFGNTITIT